MICAILLALLPLALCLAVVHVRTGSRLHFGLLSLPSEEREKDLGSGVRYFGGVGMMVAAPGVCVGAKIASEWSAEGPLAERALSFARCLAEALPEADIPPQHLTIEACAVEHVGLGTGTQLALATARAVTINAGLGRLSAVELARLTKRGARSALGIHGFSRGGLLVEAGKRQPQDISPLVVNLPVPESWRVMLIHTPFAEGLHGDRERLAFASLKRSGENAIEAGALARLVLQQLLPALIEQELHEFGDAVYNFNRLVGQMFAPAQGGSYSDPRTEHITRLLREEGAHGVGQSSWGPTVFAFTEDEAHASYVAEMVCDRCGLSSQNVGITTALNQGAAVITT